MTVEFEFQFPIGDNVVMGNFIVIEGLDGFQFPIGDKVVVVEIYL